MTTRGVREARAPHLKGRMSSPASAVGSRLHEPTRTRAQTHTRTITDSSDVHFKWMAAFFFVFTTAPRLFLFVLGRCVWWTLKENRRSGEGLWCIIYLCCGQRDGWAEKKKTGSWRVERGNPVLSRFPPVIHRCAKYCKSSSVGGGGSI